MPSLLATETAKCSRAGSVLGTCVRARDRARVRKQEATSELREADGDVKVSVRSSTYVLLEGGWAYGKGV